MKMSIEEILSKARDAFASNRTRSVEFRKNQLQKVYQMVDDNEQLFVESLAKDLRKPSFETIMAETDFVKNDVLGMLHNLDQYVAPRYVSKNLVTAFDDAFIDCEPYGLVLIIGTWNYPVMVTLSPLVGAIAAGNVAIIKPSEIAPETALTLAKLLPLYLDRECFHVITGGPEVGQRLLEQRFDYIFYTGSINVGRAVHAAGTKYLTPVTLELGGKSPLYIDGTVTNMEMAWKRILWGKMVNAGQTCVAPDYILCTEELQELLLMHAVCLLRKFFGENPKESKDIARIVSQGHFNRLRNLLKSSSRNIAIGGEVDEEDLYVSPTILTDVSLEDDIMKEEIFGPILPIVTVKDINEAIRIINKGEKPLSLYVFTNDEEVQKRFLKETSSGSVCINDTVVHLSIDALPFGGVGASGMGAYHGKYTFETFSHQKSVLVRGFNPILEWVASKRYPPYSKSNLKRLLRLLRKRKLPIPLPASFGSICTFLMGAATMYAYQSILGSGFL